MIKQDLDWGEDIFARVIENQNNYPTEQKILSIYEKYGPETRHYIRQKIRYIKLGRIEKRLCPIRRLTLANLWRYLAHKHLDIKL